MWGVPVKMEADARVGGVEADTKKRIDLMRRANEHEVLRLETELREAKNRADCAEQWLMLIRREIEDHLMPSVTAMRNGPKANQFGGTLTAIDSTHAIPLIA
jgi:hypothetical protein